MQDCPPAAVTRPHNWENKSTDVASRMWCKVRTILQRSDQFVEKLFKHRTRARVTPTARGNWTHLHAGARIQTAPEIKETVEIQAWMVALGMTLRVAMQQTNSGLFGRCFETMVTQRWYAKRKRNKKEDFPFVALIVLALNIQTIPESSTAVRRKHWIEDLINLRY